MAVLSFTPTRKHLPRVSLLKLPPDSFVDIVPKILISFKRCISGLTEWQLPLKSEFSVMLLVLHMEWTLGQDGVLSTGKMHSGNPELFVRQTGGRVGPWCDQKAEPEQVHPWGGECPQLLPGISVLLEGCHGFHALERVCALRTSELKHPGGSSHPSWEER